MRAFAIDRANPYGGEVRFFWSVCKPLVERERVYLAVHKVGRFGEGFMACSEGAFLVNENLWHELDPSQIRWQTLLDGDIGLRAPQKTVADEQNFTALSDGTLFCTYRTIEGYPCHAYSRDGGHTWTPPTHMTYGPSQRKVKHPRRQLRAAFRQRQVHLLVSQSRSELVGRAQSGLAVRRAGD